MGPAAHAQLVRNCKDALLEVLRSGNLDMLFSNAEEANSLAIQLSLTSPEGGGRASQRQAKLCSS